MGVGDDQEIAPHSARNGKVRDALGRHSVRLYRLGDCALALVRLPEMRRAHRVAKPGGDDAGAEHADPDFLGEFGAEHVGQREHRLLARGVKPRATVLEPQRMLRSGHADPPAFVLRQQRPREHRQARPRPTQVDPHQPVELCRRGLDQRAVEDRSGVGEHEVGPAQRGPGLRCQRLDAGVIADIAAQCDCVIQRRRDRLGPGEIDIGQHHPRAASGKQLGKPCRSPMPHR